MKKNLIKLFAAVFLIGALIPGLGAFAGGRLVSSDQDEIAPTETYHFQIDLSVLDAAFVEQPFGIAISGANLTSVTVNGVALASNGSSFITDSNAIGNTGVKSADATFSPDATGSFTITVTVANNEGVSSSGSVTVLLKEVMPIDPENNDKPMDPDSPASEDSSDPVDESFDGDVTGGFDFGSFGGFGAAGGGDSSVDDKTTYHGSGNNYLSTLSVAGYELDPSFHKTNTTYFLTVGADMDKISVTAKSEDKKAIAVVTGNTDLKPGLNKVLISVTAENDDVRSYRIYVTKEDM